uniref:Uncharacterized protein n=1 Tax=Arundo donax TaxID=35708 RepID=A0A0A8YN69_ARUDO
MILATATERLDAKHSVFHKTDTRYDGKQYTGLHPDVVCQRFFCGTGLMECIVPFQKERKKKVKDT